MKAGDTHPPICQTHMLAFFRPLLQQGTAFFLCVSSVTAASLCFKQMPLFARALCLMAQVSLEAEDNEGRVSQAEMPPSPAA